MATRRVPRASTIDTETRHEESAMATKRATRSTNTSITDTPHHKSATMARIRASTIDTETRHEEESAMATRRATRSTNTSITDTPHHESATVARTRASTIDTETRHEEESAMATRRATRSTTETPHHESAAMARTGRVVRGSTTHTHTHTQSATATTGRVLRASTTHTHTQSATTGRIVQASTTHTNTNTPSATTGRVTRASAAKDLLERKRTEYAKAKREYVFWITEDCEHLVKPSYFYSKATVTEIKGEFCRIEYLNGDSVRVSKLALRPPPKYPVEFGRDDDINKVLPGNRVEVLIGGDFWLGWVLDGPDSEGLYAVQFDWRSDKVKRVHGRLLRKSKIFNLATSCWEDAKSVFD